MTVADLLEKYKAAETRAKALRFASRDANAESDRAWVAYVSALYGAESEITKAAEHTLSLTEACPVTGEGGMGVATEEG